MKLFKSLMCFALSCWAAKCSTILTFDDLSPGPDYAIIQSEYGGLQWDYFGVIDGSVHGSGYLNGIISSDNVAFNLAGEAASISRSNTLFDLNSAYLTAAVANGLSVRVRGWTGPTLTYDNSYILTTAGPALVHFNYTNVNRVAFTSLPSSPFAMDNLEVTVHETPIPHVPVNLGQIQTSTIGHRFWTPLHIPNTQVVQDFLVDQDQISGGGGMPPPVSVNWDNFDQFILSITAPAGYRFLLRVPPGEAVQFGGALTWSKSAGGGTSPAGPVSVEFDGLAGVAPDFVESEAVLSDTHGWFGFFKITTSPFTNDLAFSSLKLTGTVVAQTTGSGTLNFTPDNNGALLFSYTTSATNDPGSFVSIVPIPKTPSVRISVVSPDGGVTLLVQGKAGCKNVVESSDDLVVWTAISTNVMTSTIYPAVEVTDPAATNSNRRFYRALEFQ